MIKIMKELKRFQTIRRIELKDAEQRLTPDQAIPKACGFEDATRSNSPSLKDEAAAPKTEKHGNLKKQSQFAVVQLGAKSYLKRDYGNKPAGGDGENKANQSQFQGLPSQPELLEDKKSAGVAVAEGGIASLPRS